MLYAVIKLVLSAVIIVAVAEIAKRSSLLGGLIASLPLVSLLAMTWLYIDERDATKVADLSTSIFWLVLPSLSLFIVLPQLLQKTTLGFGLSMLISIVVMLACYVAMVAALGRLGIKF
jgi:hypothetical protein